MASARGVELKQAQAELATFKAACGTQQQQITQLKVGSCCLVLPDGHQTYHK